MNQNLLLLFLLLFTSFVDAQTRVSGVIKNAKLEPLAFATIQVKEYKQSTTQTKEDGSYELYLEEGKYDLVFSMVGYKVQVMTIIVRNTPYEQNVIMDAADENTLAAVTIKGKDKAEEYIRNVILHKEAIEEAAGAYSCNVYIKAIQEDSSGEKKKKKPVPDSIINANKANAALNRMAMAEIVLHLDHASARQIKEERTGITKRGNTQSLFYLSTTEAEINFYNNLVSIPSISQTPFLSPLSYSGLLAYRFKTMKTEIVDGKKHYTIRIRPRQLSNATVEGEITIEDSSWVLLHTRLSLPKYHLTEYDFFEIEQQYQLVNNKAWMITRQEFTYDAISSKRKASGRTVVTYKNYELNKTFDNRYFGTELSSAKQEAYERDSSFWLSNRTEPLTEKEIRFIHYKDSVYQAVHSTAYLDSVDRVTNKLTWQNLLFKGQNLNDHTKSRHWRFPSLPELYQPFQLGGARIEPACWYVKTWKSRKNLTLITDFSYGFRNKDLNGSIHLNRMYNPFNRAFYTIKLEKNFEYIFSGDAWINMIQRSNIYLHKAIGIGHGFEVVYGLYLYTDLDMAIRSSVSGYKTNNRIDSLFGDVLDNNQAVDFATYQALYGKIQLTYTPWQRYIREPREKIILGSAWPTFSVLWRKGLRNVLKSDIDFDYLEFGIKQSVKLGLLGLSTYSIRTGSFLNQRDLRLVDYKYQRRGDPVLFSNPGEAFQSLDSTFATFKWFYEGHYTHEFNGAILNKIPFLKKIGLREIAGAGFLIAPERDLRYAELFTGIERVFKYPFNLLGKFKLGVYVVGSMANQFRNPVQFKVGITAWDRKKGKWF